MDRGRGEMKGSVGGARRVLKRGGRLRGRKGVKMRKRLTEYEENDEEHGSQEERLRVYPAKGDVEGTESRVARKHHDTQTSERHCKRKE